MRKLLFFIARFSFEISSHFLALAVVFWTFLPLSAWYMNHKPILGVDFYNMVANAAYYSRHWHWRFGGFRPINWSGYPYGFDYPSLHFYLIYPLVSYFGVQRAVLIYTMGALLLFAFCSYFFFWVISRNKVISTVLAVFSLYSIGVWGPVIWGGNLPYVATMFFLPLSMGFVALYLQSRTRKNLAVAALLCGISALGHPQILVSYTIIFATLVLLCGYFTQVKASIKRRFADVGIYTGIVILVSYVQFQNYLGQNILYLPFRIVDHLDPLFRRLFSSSVRTAAPDYGYSLVANVSKETAAAIANYNEAQFWRIKTDINMGFFVFLGLAAILLLMAIIFAKKRKRVFGALPYVLFLGLLIISIFGLSHGFSFFQGGWYRSFWAMPLAIGALVAFSWRVFSLALLERIKKLNISILKIFVTAVFSMAIFGLAYFLWSQQTAGQFTDKADTVLYREKSGVFPEVLNKPVSRGEFEGLRDRLVPSWLPKDTHQYRLFTADQKVNVWWPTFYEMPLVRGYTDVPIGSGVAGGFYWTDIALAAASGRDPLVDDYKIPKEIAKNNALFLIDWYSVGYFEGGHEGSDSFNPPASYLLSDKSIFEKETKVSLPGYAAVYAEGSAKIVWKDDVSHALKYFKFKEGLASPIAAATDASVVGFVGSYQSYDAFLRVLGMTNTNSKALIPLWFGESLDKMPNLEGLNLDGLILYGYTNGSSQRGLSRVDKYLQKGGKVFIETGSDVFQTQKQELPKFFPINGTRRDKLGETWDLTDFGPPTLDGKPWEYSLPTGVKPGAKVILKTGGTPLMVQGAYGSGQVIWSGTNLFFHANVYKNLKEGEFIRSLIAGWLPLEEKKQPESSGQFVSNQEVKIITSGAKAVLLRQEYHDGWQAKVNGEAAQIYPTGPTYPGFMYVFLPEKFGSKQVEVIFRYSGDRWTFYYTILTVLVSAAILDYLFGARGIGFSWRHLKSIFGSSVVKWWKKEDE